MSLSLKVTLKDNDVTEVRRFTIDLDERQPSLKALQQKLVDLFPDQLIRKDYKIKWKDSDSDWVTVLSDEELSVALKEMTARLFLVEIFDQHSSRFKHSGKWKDSHVGIACKGCGNNNIVGFRYKCIICPNYDLCSDCETGGHHLSHYMMRIATPEDAWPQNTFWRLEPLKEPTCGCGLCSFQTWNSSKTHGRTTAKHPGICESESSSCRVPAHVPEALQSEEGLDQAAEQDDISNHHTDNEDCCSESNESQSTTDELVPQPEKHQQETDETLLQQQAKSDTTCSQSEPDHKPVEITPQVESDIHDQESCNLSESVTERAEISVQKLGDQTDLFNPDPVNAPEPITEKIDFAEQASGDLFLPDPVNDQDLDSELQASKDDTPSLDIQGSLDNYDANPENDYTNPRIQKSIEGNENSNLDIQQLTDKEIKSLIRPYSSSSSSSSSAEDSLNVTIPYVTILDEGSPDESGKPDNNEDDLDSSMPVGFEASSLRQVSSAHSLNNVNEPLCKNQHGNNNQSDDGIPGELGQPISTFVSVYNLNDGVHQKTEEDSGTKNKTKR